MIEVLTGLITQVVAGFMFIVGGGLLVRYSLQMATKAHEMGQEESYLLTWVGVGVSVLGACFLPSIFGIVNKVYIMVFPNGLPIPWVNGRRAGDPQIPPTVPPGDGL